MKYQISTLILCVACLITVITCNSRPTDEDIQVAAMENEIEGMKNTIDRFSQSYNSYSDAIDTGDLLTIEKDFHQASELEAKIAYYNMYCKEYDRVFKYTLQYVEHKAKCDTISNLPIHVCPKN